MATANANSFVAPERNGLGDVIAFVDTARPRPLGALASDGT